MKTLMMLLVTSYVSGNAPFCTVDNSGNMNCYYWSVSSCHEALDRMGNPGICTINPNR